MLVLTDDQGYGDLSAHGNPVLQTPHLDRLQAESLRFTDFLVSPTCSPTRAALMTGRHEFANGVAHTIYEWERLTLAATTIAQTYPGSYGDAPDNGYFDPALLHNGTFEKTEGYCTDLFFRQAFQWIEAQATAEKPFFAYIATNAPHAPYVARPEDRTRYEGRGRLKPSQQNFFGMIHNIDENVGRLVNRLDELGIAETTLVVYMNDNGGTAGVPIFNAGMRGAKGTPWIGGTRAMSLWRWPGRIHPGTCDRLVAHIDVFPTFAELAGVDLAADGSLHDQVAGRSLVPLLTDPAAPEGLAWDERPLFTHVGRWPKRSDPDLAKYQAAAVRTKAWALVSPEGGPEPDWQLYDLRTDYGQQHDVRAAHPDVASRLAAAFDNWWADVLTRLINEQAVGPQINPFQELYYRQFGGQPTPEALERMRPEREVLSPQRRSPQPKTTPAG